MMTLRQHRERNYLSTRELASKAGVGADTIWRIEGGDYKKLRPSTMRKIAEALGVHPADIAEFVPPVHDLHERSDSGLIGTLPTIE